MASDSGVTYLATSSLVHAKFFFGQKLPIAQAVLLASCFLVLAQCELFNRSKRTPAKSNCHSGNQIRIWVKTRVRERLVRAA